MALSPGSVGEARHIWTRLLTLAYWLSQPYLLFFLFFYLDPEHFSAPTRIIALTTMSLSLSLSLCLCVPTDVYRNQINRRFEEGQKGLQSA